MEKDPIYFLTENALLANEKGTSKKSGFLVTLYFIFLADEDQADSSRYYYNQTTSKQAVDKIGEGRSHV
jgi:hypothetical protein